MRSIAAGIVAADGSMVSLAGIAVFCTILFVYLHVFFHLKTSDDLEVYEIDRPSKEKLEEICDLRQPVLFPLEASALHGVASLGMAEASYGAFDVHMRPCGPPAGEATAVDLKTCRRIVEAGGAYLSESNADFLEETGLVKSMRGADGFLRPSMVANCDYDVMYGGKGACTSLRYSKEYRNYFSVLEGRVRVKLSPPRSSRYFFPMADYSEFRFESPVDAWAPQSQYVADAEKARYLEVDMRPGECLFIPARWWHSIRFEETASVAVFRYRTYMSAISLAPELFIGALQSLNVRYHLAPVCEDGLGKKRHRDYAGPTVETTQEPQPDEEQAREPVAEASAASPTPISELPPSTQSTRVEAGGDAERSPEAGAE